MASRSGKVCRLGGLLAMAAVLLAACSWGRDAGDPARETQAASPAPLQTFPDSTLDSSLARPPPDPRRTRAFHSPLPTPTAAPTPVPTATIYVPPPSATPAPTFTRRPTHTPRPTLPQTATPTPTPTLLPYTDAPFAVVYLREGSLWSAGPDGQEEHRLTDELEGWPVDAFAVSPDCRRVAYLARNADTGDTVIKAVRVDEGVVEVLTGENDPYEVRFARVARLGRGL